MSLGARLLNVVLKFAGGIGCPSCGHKFSFPEARQLRSMDDTITCPACGRTLSLKEFVQLSGAAQHRRRLDFFHASEPVPLPEGSKIREEPDPMGGIRLLIPRSGRSNGLLVFGIVWLLFSGAFLVLALVGMFARGEPVPPLRLFGTIGFLSIFELVGVVLVICGINLKFADHILRLSPDKVELHKQVLGRRSSKSVGTHEVRKAHATVFYSKNYQPVFGIEIDAGRRKLRFGSGLTDEEKRYLVWRIRDYLGRTAGIRFEGES